MSLRAIRTLWCDFADCGEWHGQADIGESDVRSMRRAAAKDGWTRVGNDDICQRHPQSARAPRVWPIGSPEPEEKGLRVRATNEVEFVHEGGSFRPWHAKPPIGDDRFYDWRGMNCGPDAMVLTEVVSGGAG